uniref:Uncharacterized protein n=1 Tax=Megaselia scalaris TaxID=36166 RepID=T1GXV4_MEGSC
MSLTNMFLLLRQKFGSYNVVHNYPPSYLQKIVGNEKIIFICKQDKSFRSSNEYIPKTTPVKREIDLDLTG